jgi:molybdopterin-binding protein
VPRQEVPIGDAARLLGVSVDTLRRWDRAGRIATRRDRSNRRVVPVEEVERLRSAGPAAAVSARNRFPGTVRSVTVEGLLAQVELDAGPFRIVSVVTREAVEQLGLRPGAPATALVKATSVLIER